jgi:CHAD domain-containing protein
MQTHSFLVNNKENEQVVEIIESLYPVKKTAGKSINLIYYDTFDLSLQKKGLIFCKTGTNYTLQPINVENNTQPITFNSSKQLKFWQDLPTSDLKNKFKKILGIRALIAFASLKNDQQPCNIVDLEEKIIARISLESFLLDNSDGFLGKILTLKAIKGYNKHYNKLLDLLAIQNQMQPLEQEDFMQLIVDGGGIIPMKYTAKPINIDEAQMPASDAVKKLLFSLLAVIKINEDGVIKDIDTEFLHDFRVAIRRTRSILNLLKVIFNEGAVLPYKFKFASLAESTNKLRDYDVYLLNKDSYLQMLPSHLHKGLNQFFINIKKRKKYEHRKLVQRLNSSSYREFISSWKEFLENNNDIFDGTNSTIPVIDLARKHIYNKSKKILKKGAKINRESPDSSLHDLRLDCKKLRYLVEFFSELFPKKDITILVNQLKKLQDCLGEFNDYSIQQIHLEDYLLTINASASNSIELSATIGALISASYQEKQKRRNAFFRIFKTFACEKNINLYFMLFSMVS